MTVTVMRWTNVSVPSRGDWQGVILAEAAGGDETTRASELGS